MFVLVSVLASKFFKKSIKLHKTCKKLCKSSANLELQLFFVQLQMSTGLHRHKMRGTLSWGLLGRGLLRGLPVQRQQLCLPSHLGMRLQARLHRYDLIHFYRVRQKYLDKNLDIKNLSFFTTNSVFKMLLSCIW